MKLKSMVSLGLGLVALSTFSACNSVPEQKLTKDQRIWDMHWMYSIISQNYAPLDYKQQEFKFKLAEIEGKYEADAAASFDIDPADSNQAFYDLMFKFVSEFHDAHTSASLTNSALAGRAKVAYLGFSGYRNGDELIVKKLLPTYDKDSPYPIKEGDHILKMNGKTLKEAVNQEQIAFRNLGNEEANYTYHMNKLFNRMSTQNGMPKDRAATLTVKRGDKTFEVTLPWVVQDVSEFKEEQAKAEEDEDAKTKANQPKTSFLVDNNGNQFRFNFLGFDGLSQNPIDVIQKITRMPVERDRAFRYRVTDGFRFVDNFAQWNAVLNKIGVSASDEKEKTPIEKIEAERSTPDRLSPIASAKTFPAYVTQVKILDSEGTATGETMMLGYIYLNTFSPGGDEDTVVKEFRATLDEFQNLNVKNIIIDTINNGGGSLNLGMKLARSLSNKKADVKLPYIQFRKSDTWRSQFEKTAKSGENPSIRSLAQDALTEWDRGNPHHDDLLSTPLSLEILAPFELEANPNVETKFNTVVLVNEMCASMCDIFAGILQDNKMATIVGTRTMGAGGNVVNHQEAPSSHLDLRQTESLIVRSNGELLGAPKPTDLDSVAYVHNRGPGALLENKGVIPDVEIAVNEYAKDKYQQVIQKGVNVLTGAEKISSKKNMIQLVGWK